MSRRTTFDILADILTVVSYPSSKTEIMALANLSFDQCQRYLPDLERLGLVNRILQDGIHAKFAITERGIEYHSKMSEAFGRIAVGDRSIWVYRRGLVAPEASA